MTTEIDALFDRLKGGSFDADPNSIPQEGAIGSSSLAGIGWVQSGGIPQTHIGYTPYTGQEGVQTLDLATTEALLVPVSLPGQMTLTRFVYMMSCTGTVLREAVLCADSGQSNALTIVARGPASGSESLGGQVMGMVQGIFGAETVLPPGNYWLIIRNASVSTVMTIGGFLPNISFSNGCRKATLSSSLGVPGDQLLIVEGSWTGIASQPAGIIVGKALGFNF